MCYSLSLNSLPSFSLADVNKLLQTEGYNLSRLDSLPSETWDYVLIPLCFSVGDSWTGNREEGGSVSLYLRKDGRGLYLDIAYKYRKRIRFRKMRIRYYLTRRESNLIPGTYRYYILNPYQCGEALCSKLYYFPESGRFLPRSVLSSQGVLYSLQRKGHSERYYFGLRLPSWEDLRYRKTHYRGKETPFWKRYQDLQDRKEERFIEFVQLRRKRFQGTPPSPPE